jgi:MFS family permease
VLCGLIVVDLISTLIKVPDLLIGLRFFHGLMGGLLVGVAFAVIARTKTPDRTFGMLLVVQFGLGGLGLMFLPRLVPVFGHGVLFLSLAAFSAVTLAMTPFLGVYASPPISSGLGGPRVWNSD